MQTLDHVVAALRDESTDAADRLQVALRPGALPAGVLRAFAASEALVALERERDAGHYIDPRAWSAVLVATRHAAGNATDDHLEGACADAWQAARCSAQLVSMADTVHRAAVRALASAERAAAYSAGVDDTSEVRDPDADASYAARATVCASAGAASLRGVDECVTVAAQVARLVAAIEAAFSSADF